MEGKISNQFIHIDYSKQKKVLNNKEILKLPQ